MKIEEIMALWERDAVIDSTELGDESLKIPRLHHKYYQLLIVEKMTLRKMEADGKRLRLAKYEHLTQGPSKEDWKDDWKKDWKSPSKGQILKNEVSTYLDGDDDLVDHSLKVDYQREKCEALERILKMVGDRSFHVGRALEFLRFTNGG